MICRPIFMHYGCWRSSRHAIPAPHLAEGALHFEGKRPLIEQWRLAHALAKPRSQGAVSCGLHRVARSNGDILFAGLGNETFETELGERSDGIARECAGSR